MTQRTAKWIAWSSPVLFCLSMVVPPQAFTDDMSELKFGFQLVFLCFIGVADGSPLCIVGGIANIAVVLGLILLLIRSVRGRPWPTFRIIAWFALASGLAMLTSRVWLVTPQLWLLFTPGFLLWFGSSLSLAAGAWSLKDEQNLKMQRGFEVVPVAVPAANVESSPETARDDSGWTHQ